MEAQTKTGKKSTEASGATFASWMRYEPTKKKKKKKKKIYNTIKKKKDRVTTRRNFIKR